MILVVACLSSTSSFQNCEPACFTPFVAHWHPKTGSSPKAEAAQNDDRLRFRHLEQCREELARGSEFVLSNRPRPRLRHHGRHGKGVARGCCCEVGRVLHTVDGSGIPNNHLGCIPNLVNLGINYQPQLVS